MARMIERCIIAAMLALALSVSAAAEVVYNRGNDGDPETLDPHKTSAVAEAHILRDLLEGLVVYNAKAEIVPGTAESWTISPDGRTYTFALRADARWSNGDPVRAADFVYSYQRIMSPDTGAKYANILYPILNAGRIHKGQAKADELGVKAL